MPVPAELQPAAHLMHRTPDGWSPLPAWAQFMLDAGSRAASIRHDDARLVIALSIPARAFAAVLAAAGAVVTAFQENPPTSDVAEHFDYLASLPEGTAISHRRGNSVEQGRIACVEVGDDGKPRVRVRLRKEETLLPVNLCSRIQVIDDPGTLKAHKRTLVKEPEFLAGALPAVDATSLSASTRLDCVLVGVQRSLEAELTTREFGAGDDQAVYEGNLQGIVRARDIGGTKDAYRSALVPAASEDGDAPIAASVPKVAIFDGARAFNGWRSRWPGSNWLVLLDRGLPSAGDGAAAVNQSYATRVDTSDALAGLGIPAGVETLAYLERL